MEEVLILKPYLSLEDSNVRRELIENSVFYTLFANFSDLQSPCFKAMISIEFGKTEKESPLAIDFYGEINALYVNGSKLFDEHEEPRIAALYNGSLIVIPAEKLEPQLNTILVVYTCHYNSDGSGASKFQAGSKSRSGGEGQFPKISKRGSTTSTISSNSGNGSHKLETAP